MKFVFSIVFVLLAQIVIASGRLKGVIMDEERSTPLLGVNVTIEDINIGTATDKEGKFFISGIPAGNYLLTFSMVGYEHKAVNIIISDNETIELKISLLSVILQLPIVTVTGQAKRNVFETPYIESAGLELSTTTVTRQEISRQEIGRAHV